MTPNLLRFSLTVSLSPQLGEVIDGVTASGALKSHDWRIDETWI